MQKNKKLLETKIKERGFKMVWHGEELSQEELQHIINTRGLPANLNSKERGFKMVRHGEELSPARLQQILNNRGLPGNLNGKKVFDEPHPGVYVLFMDQSFTPLDEKEHEKMIELLESRKWTPESHSSPRRMGNALAAGGYLQSDEINHTDMIAPSRTHSKLPRAMLI